MVMVGVLDVPLLSKGSYHRIFYSKILMYLWITWSFVAMQILTHWVLGEAQVFTFLTSCPGDANATLKIVRCYFALALTAFLQAGHTWAVAGSGDNSGRQQEGTWWYRARWRSASSQGWAVPTLGTKRPFFPGFGHTLSQHMGVYWNPSSERTRASDLVPNCPFPHSVAHADCQDLNVPFSQTKHQTDFSGL